MKKSQIDILADYILKEFWYEIGNADRPNGESAVEVAIKLLERYKELIVNKETLELNIIEKNI